MAQHKELLGNVSYEVTLTTYALGVTYLQFLIQVCFFSLIAATGFLNFTFSFSQKRYFRPVIFGLCL